MSISIHQSISSYLNSVELARSPRTASTYKNALNFYISVLQSRHLDLETQDVKSLSEDTIVWITNALKDHAATTERLYLTAVTGFFEYLVAERLADINLPRVRLLIQQRARKPGQRLPQFPTSQIDLILEKAELLLNKPYEDLSERLVNLRDRAFLYTLADTGFVHDAVEILTGTKASMIIGTCEVFPRDNCWTERPRLGTIAVQAKKLNRSRQLPEEIS